ncbi:MAG: hypothetical protein QOI50_1827, partial [Pseudonocardiales bacterium]|nr:hypothetical protein [Pseudonocardiales bacterium]
MTAATDTERGEPVLDRTHVRG